MHVGTKNKNLFCINSRVFFLFFLNCRCFDILRESVLLFVFILMLLFVFVIFVFVIFLFVIVDVGAADECCCKVFKFRLVCILF